MTTSKMMMYSSNSQVDLEQQQASLKPQDWDLGHSPTAQSSFTEELTVVVGSRSTSPSVIGSDAVKSESKTEDPYLVTWDDPDDPENPKNWSVLYRWYITAISGLLVLSATFASSAPSGILRQLTSELHLNHTLSILTISLFVAGYCVGPLLWGPLSEQFGRKPVLLLTFAGYAAFQVGGALARNTTSVLVFRFLGGTFAASPLTTSGGIIGDIWDADVRGKAVAIFTVAPFAGPALGPIVAGYIDVAGISWRWLFWITAIFAGFCFFVVLLTVPETYAPVLLTRKAERKRKETGNEKFRSELERREMRLADRVEAVVLKPFKILFVEPMLIAMTLYLGFLYGAVYLCFEAYPIVFTLGHHLNAGESGLTFIPLFLGGIIGVVTYLLYFNPQYELQIAKHAPKPVPPEQRLIPAFYGGPLLMISFLWFGWTSFPSISLWVPLMSGLFLGTAVIFIFLALFNYIIDAYLAISASALASNTVIRSAFGAIFPLFSTQLYEALNPRWASTLLAAITLVMLPIPFVLYRYGASIRRTSRYAPTVEY
ncbi:hypothetical protein FRB90_011795 [Tulasnella sp. 427]|nr:hypothetical protein FRB90_011795 [Tulasnella sp. 427]